MVFLLGPERLAAEKCWQVDEEREERDCLCESERSVP